MNDNTLLTSKSINGISNDQRDPMKLLLWTVADLQKVIGCGRRQAYDLCNRQGFPAIRMGRKIMIPRDGFLKWLERETEQAAG